MRHAFRKFSRWIAVASLVAGLTGMAAADYELTFFSIDAASETQSAAGGTYELQFTVGQPDAAKTMGADYVLVGGFWSVAQDIPCPGDLDLNRTIDLADLAGLLAAFGSMTGDANFNPNADLDNSGAIDLADLSGILGLFGTICGC